MLQYKVGIDIGSTTLKVVVLNEKNEIIYKSYERHKSKALQLTYTKIKELENILNGKELKIAITGSAGLGAANKSNIDFVQEVFATAGAVEILYPQTDCVIELGGEDAKIIFLKGGVEQRMNSTCAGGTGAFIDQMASLLNVSLEELDRLSQNATDIYPIASRCGVFAKTDIQPLINQGAAKENIAASIFGAVVDQTIAGLAQGRTIKGNVLFLGGPLAFLKGLQDRFVKTLGLSSQHAFFPKLAQYFVALGAAIYSEKTAKTYTYPELMTLLENMINIKDDFDGLDALFKNEQDYNAFKARHAKTEIPKNDINSYTGNAYLGIDAGSTTTKIVLIDENNNFLYSHYCSNEGSPLNVVREHLENIYRLMGDHIKICASAVTGYGEDLIKNAFSLDFGIVETIAHYTAAKFFNPLVDFIIDIGGQDIKCFQIRDGAINSIMLNEACSSGCGSFIETFAHSLGYSVKDFAKIAVKAKRPVDLGTRCTVFMNSSVKQAQKNGASIEDISAGLAVSVVKNAIYKVIRAKNADELGEHIVVQGGTFYNDAVLRCFEKEIGREVIRPADSGLMGAFGCALFAKNNADNSTGTISKEDLAAFTHTSKFINCGMCTNKCALTVNTFNNNRKFISGNRCENPIKNSKTKSLPNLFEKKMELLKEIAEKKNPAAYRGTIGLPLALNMYENLPFWHEFFTSLGFSPVTSDVSSRKLYTLGQHTIPSDTVCYPAKLVHGHILNLISKKTDYIFYPCMSYNFDEKISDNCYNCPVVAYYPELIAANIPKLINIPFLYPYISLNNEKIFSDKIYNILKQTFQDIKKSEIKKAAKNAYKAYYKYKNDVLEYGKKAISYADENNLNIIVLAGRPYHIDPEINHGIDKLISTLGFVLLSEDAIPGLEKAQYNVLNQWTYHARMYNAARFTIEKKNAELVQLVSFGCGIDAVTTDEVSSILRSHNKLYTQIKIDEINNLGAVKIRLRSLLATIKEREKL